MSEATSEEIILALWANRIKGVEEVVAGLVHELNQPLSGINLHAENVLGCLEDGLPLEQEEIRNAMRWISRQVERVSERLESVRRLGRSVDLTSRHETEVRDVALSVTPLLEARLASRGVEFTFEAPTFPVVVEANVEAIATIFLVLLGNARDAVAGEDRRGASTSGGVVLRIRAEKADGNRGDCVIEVEDDGPGVSDAVREWLLEPTLRAEAIRGGGLGLAVVKIIVEALNGDFELNLGSGRGTRAVARLPLFAGENRVEDSHDRK